MTDLAPILSRLVSARKRSGISQKKAADALHLRTQQAISRLERRQLKLTVELLLDCCALYNVSSCWVLTGEEHEPTRKAG